MNTSRKGEPMGIVKVRQRGKVSIISINRPERHNTICKDTALELQLTFNDFDASNQRVAVLTGEGDEAFSAGADVTNLPELWRCVPTIGITFFYLFLLPYYFKQFRLLCTINTQRPFEVGEALLCMIIK
jgi:enoyl-CoA hydratase/carnithine racemase